MLRVLRVWVRGPMYIIIDREASMVVAIVESATRCTMEHANGWVMATSSAVGLVISANIILLPPHHSGIRSDLLSTQSERPQEGPLFDSSCDRTGVSTHSCDIEDY